MSMIRQLLIAALLSLASTAFAQKYTNCGKGGEEGDFGIGATPEQMAAVCEFTLPPYSKRGIQDARNCDAALRQKFESKSQRSESVRELARTARACAEANAANAVNISKFPNVPRRNSYVVGFLDDAAKELHRMADSLYLAASFNEAVERNDVRIALGAVKFLVTKEAKSFVPSALTTATLYTEYEKVKRKMSEDASRFNSNWNELVQDLTYNTFIEFYR